MRSSCLTAFISISFIYSLLCTPAWNSSEPGFIPPPATPTPLPSLQTGRVSGAAKFVYIAEEDTAFGFVGPKLPECGRLIERTEGGREPFEMRSARSLAPGTQLYIPSILPDNGFETTIAVQNVGINFVVAHIVYLDDMEATVGSDCRTIGVGSSATFGPETIPDEARCAVITSNYLFETGPPKGPPGPPDIFEVCNGTDIPEAPTGKGLFEKGDPNNIPPLITAQVQRISTNQDPSQPLASTMYNVPSNYMGDRFGSGVQYRYILPRVITSPTRETRVSILNAGPAPTVYRMVSIDELTGVTQEVISGSPAKGIFRQCAGLPDGVRPICV